MYEKLGKELPGKVAVKLHSGEQGNQNYIRPEFVKAIVERVNGTVVECNAASSVVNYFKDNILFINVMCNLSVDCDCCAVAEDPCMKDIGILASTDPIAIDQACIDLIYNSKDPGRDHFVERVERQNGRHTIDAATELGFGTKEYELINVD